MPEFALTGSGLTKAFGGIAAVSGVDISVRAGEIVGILGPNGSGKTTLMSLLAGLVRPDRGKVSAVGRDVTHAAPYSAKRRDVACALQHPRVFTSLTVRQNLEIALRARRKHGRESAEQINGLLELLGLAHADSLVAGALSGGQKKLLDLARTAVVTPRVLLADEPTAGVSHAGQRLMSTAFERAAADGAAVLLVSHDLPWTFAQCQRIVFMRAGEVVLEGTPDEVQSDPRIVEAYLR